MWRPSVHQGNVIQGQGNTINSKLSLFPNIVSVVLTIFVIIHTKYAKPAFTRDSRLVTVDAPRQVPFLPSPKSGPGPECSRKDGRCKSC